MHEAIPGVTEVSFEVVDIGNAAEAPPPPKPVVTQRSMVLIQGLSGKGKTTFATRGGRPLILAVEPKSASIAHHHNPQAKVYPVDSRESLERAIAMLANPKLAERDYDRVVLDSFSELTDRIPIFYGMSYPLQLQDYGTIGKRAMAIIDALEKCPLPSVVICRSVAKDQGKLNRVIPYSNGSSAAGLPSRCVCTAETRFDDRDGWVADTSPDDHSQRSGLPWLPSIWQGTVNEFLKVVEGGPQAATSVEPTK